jgi:aminoglycoside phosphotransferase (APT) family kinase protein
MVETCPSMMDVIPDDAALPGLSAACPHRMLEILRSAPEVATVEEREAWRTCSMTEAIYQPGRACRIAYVLGRGDDDERKVLMYVRWDPLSRPHESAVQLHAEGGGFQVYRYPRDRRMRQIRSMRRDEWLRKASETWFRQAHGEGHIAEAGWRCTPIKYVPESRLVCRLKACWTGAGDDKWVRAYVRISRRNDAATQFATMARIRDALAKSGAPIDVPCPLGVIVSRHLLATEFVRGRSLKQLAQEGRTDEVVSICSRLAQLHRHGSGATSEPEGMRADRRREMLHDLSYEAPDRADLCAELNAWCAVEPSKSDATGLIHGDLHSGQVILRGPRVCVIDWDRAALGDGTQDILNLALDFSEAPWLNTPGASKGDELASASVAAWRSAGGPWHADSARWWAVHSLVLRAWGFMRHLRPNWPAMTRRLLEQARTTWLDGLQMEVA